MMIDRIPKSLKNKSGRTLSQESARLVDGLCRVGLAGRRACRTVDTGTDRAVPVVQRVAEQRGAADGDEADERGEKSVFDEVLALFITDEAGEEVLEVHSGHLPGSDNPSAHAAGSV